MICRPLFAVALLLMAAPLAGCSGFDRVYYGDCGGPLALSGRNGDYCGAGGCARGACGPDDCGDCGACDACCIHPLRWLWSRLGCSHGCGEFYFDEWINDPPDRCDPCDDYGCYAGPQGSCRRWWQLLGMRSYRYGRDCDTSCGLGCDDGGYEDGYPIDGGELVPQPVPMEPTPADMATRPAGKEPYYTPQNRRASHVAPARSTQPSAVKIPVTTSAPIGSGVRR